MTRHEHPEERFPVRLTLAQRKVLAEILPGLAGRLELKEANQRAIPLSLAELRQINEKAENAILHASTGMKRNSLRHVRDIAAQAIEESQGLGAIPASERIFQFKITLLGLKPPIWRRVQIRDCTLDKLNEHVQTAMGWTNSHLHHFKVGEQLYGDPDLMQENFEDMAYLDSTTTKVTDILPKSGERIRFEHEYDFGDGWQHEILFEGCLRADPGQRYPLCLEGQRACPPEDVGGVWGYADFVEAIQNPGHEQHEELLEWIGGSFDPESFDRILATRQMQRGLPNWRDWA